jgi:tetratricopeptide (TPR) repeat protein
LLLLVLPGTSASAAQGRDLAAFQDSVQRMDDVDQLRVMLADRSSRHAERSPVSLSERGFVALRLWDLTSRTSHSRAAQESFKQAIKRAPDYGWAHYGLGLSYANSPSTQPEKLGWRAAFVLDDAIENVLGTDALSRAHREFTKAVTSEPPVVRAADDLADNAIQKNRLKLIEDARKSLTGFLDSGATDGEAWLALAKVQAELGELGEAVAAADRAFELGVSTPDILHTRAVALLRTHGREQEGAQAWLAGVANLTAPLSDRYYRDIYALFSKQERARWKQMDIDARSNFLRTFWEIRAALAGVTVPERMAEHYRRLAVARRAFTRNGKFRAPPTDALLYESARDRPDFDDRGVIYIRHGEPRARYSTPGAEMANDSWSYAGLDGRPVMLHFFKPSDGTDYVLMHKVPCDAEWLGDRAGFDSRLGRLGMRCDALERASLSASLREISYQMLATDSDRPNFTKELPFYFDLYTFRADQGRTDVLAAVAVPAERLNRPARFDGGQYRIDISLILADTASKRVIRQDDSVSLGTLPAFGANELFRLHVELAAPPSPSTVQRVIVSDPTEPGIGQLYGGPFPIPDYSGNQLMLSDIVLAEPGISGQWHRGEVALALVPTGYFKGGSFNIFYEIYNIAPNAPYSTEIEIEPMRRSAGEKIKNLFGGKSKMTLRFEGAATNVHNAALQELRQVEAPLPPGQYRLRVTVKDLETQQTARSERLFAVPKD